MRFPICVAVVIWLEAVGAHADPSDAITTLPVARWEVPSTRRLRGHELAREDEEEKGIAEELKLVASALEKSTGAHNNILMGVDTPSVELDRSKLKEFEAEHQLPLDARAPSFESEISKLKEVEDTHLQLSLNGWTPPVKSGTSKLKEVEAKHLQLSLNDWTPPVQSSTSKSKEITNKKRQLPPDGLTPSAESIPSDFSKPKSGRLTEEETQKWGEYTPSQLFQVLKLHEAKNEAANRVLIAYNLGIWLRRVVHDRKKLDAAVLRSCGGDQNQAHFLFQRLTGFRKEASDLVMWLQAKKSPDDVFKSLKLDEAKDQLLDRNEMSWWIEYFDAFKHVYPEQETTLLSAIHMSDETLVNLVFTAEIREVNTRRRVLKELMDAWHKLEITPVDACALLGLLPNLDTGLDFRRFAAWTKYLNFWNMNRDSNQKRAMKDIHLMYSWDQLDKLRQNGDPSDELTQTLAALIVASKRTELEENATPSSLSSLTDQQRKKQKTTHSFV